MMEARAAARAANEARKQSLREKNSPAPTPPAEQTQPTEPEQTRPAEREKAPRTALLTRREQEVELPDSAIFANDIRTEEMVTTVADYDPDNRVFIMRTKIGDTEVSTPYLLTQPEYDRYSEQVLMHRYWQQKISEVGHSNERKFDITDMKFDIGPADKVFGPGGVQIKMNGSAELLFGFKHTFTDNPSLTQRSRTNNIFDFNEKIQAGVNAKVGDKLSFNLNYNTESSFSFDQQNLKLAYQGKEDDIIQSLEAGNVTMDLNSRLITGAQALFGVKTNLQFGKLKIQALVSQQNSQSQTVSSKGGAQMTSFEIPIDQYDENRHFFLTYFFRDKYEDAMQNLPVPNTGVAINKIEVWVTNKRGSYDNARNLFALVDLGEAGPHVYNPTWSRTQSPIASNESNPLYATLQADARVRDIRQVSTVADELGMSPGADYEKLESARLLSPSEYTVNSALGFISLKASLRQDEVLAVAYEYTYAGQVYQVGEFSTNAIGSEQADGSQPTLLVKLLKANGTSPDSKGRGAWDLMMKNVYSLGASSLSSTNFTLDVLYRNDSVGTQVRYLAEGDPAIVGKPLIRVLGLDRLDGRNNPSPDGRFDWVDGYTVLASQGRIIFPALEPFGAYLRDKIGNRAIAEKYIFPELYDSTLVVAQEMTEKNKFVLRGQFSGSAGNQISLNAMNVPRGSVTVTAGGATLVENVDYTVDYVSGIVTIINQSILDSGTDISVKLENQSTFSLTRKTLIGTNIRYDFTPDFSIGGTIMHMSERPLTTKVTSGSEPISNTIWGLNLAYRTELPWLNAAINAIPWMKANSPSTFTIGGEFAQLIPGHTREVGRAGTAYLDDFENSQTQIDVHYPSAWVLASTPRRFAEAIDLNSATYNRHRALLNWYTVDPIFGYPQPNTPAHVRDSKEQMSDHRVRIIYEQEIFPNKESVSTDDNRLNALSLSYYPEERGPYNIDPSAFVIRDRKALLAQPRQSWGGMMRRLENTDFENANIEYLEFWLMDPALTNPDYATSYHARLYINLGDISEDILRDGKKSFEHGLPTDPTDVSKVESTFWGLVPRTTSTVNAFSNESNGRRQQDVGFDGLPNDREYSYQYGNVRPYGDFVDAMIAKDPSVRGAWATDSFSIINDPAGDRYHYYRGSDYDQRQVPVLERYKYYNHPEGNSPATADQNESYGTAATLNPDGEDVNHDNTLSETDKYYEYCVEIDPTQMVVGRQNITSSVTSRVNTQDGEQKQVTWFQFKIPLRNREGDGVTRVGSIRNMKNIRFMRIYITDAEHETHLRFGTMNFVRGEWRQYNKSLVLSPTTPESNGSLDVQAVNIEENGKRQPVNYVLPPGISRQTDPGQASLVAENEQAMALRVHQLGAGDARAVYKGTHFDMRNYKRLMLFVHAEKNEEEDPSLKDHDLTAFIRLGTDLKYNYYEYEIPLVLTEPGNYNNNNEADRYRVWPAENAFDFPLSVFTDLKTRRNRERRGGNTEVTLQTRYTSADYDNSKPENLVTVMGNPTLEDIQYIMIGVRNASAGDQPHSAEVWVNELRLSEFNEKGGIAAMANATLAISDIAQFNISGRMETAGYGSIESNVLSRNMDDNYQLQLSASMEAGRLFPEQAKLQIPLYVSYSNQTTSPQYDPLDTDIKLKENLDSYSDREQRDSVKAVTRTVQKSTSFSVTNMKLNIHSRKRDMFYDPANFSIGASYSRTEQHSPDVVKNVTTDQRGNFTYAYNFNPQPWEPGKNSKAKSKFIKEFNLYYLPQSWGFSTTMHRQFNQAQQRELTGTIAQTPLELTTWSKDFTWDRHFNFAYNLTRSMKFSFQSAMNSTVDEGLYTKEIIRDYLFENKYYEAWRDTIQRSLAKWGSPYTYQQVFNASWTVPFDRIPGLDALSANASYNATYNWARTQSAAARADMGNTISSVQSWQADGSINAETWYSKSKYWKSMTQFYQGRQRVSRNFKSKIYTAKVNLRRGEPTKINHRLSSSTYDVTATDSLGRIVHIRVVPDGNNAALIHARRDLDNVDVIFITRDPNSRTAAQVTGDIFTYMGTMIRKVQVTYRSTNSLSLPGFSPEIGFFGQRKMGADAGGYAPGWDFAFGFIPDNYIERAKKNGWLSTDTTMVQPATQSRTSDMDIRITLEPLPGLKIQVSGKRYTSDTRTTIYSYGDIQQTISGTFNITQVALASLFKSVGNADNNYQSEVFNQFLINRDIMQQRVQDRYRGIDYPTSGFMRGQIYSADGKYDPKNGTVSRNNPDVLVPAFLAAYTGRDVRRIRFSPILGIQHILPNWNITYDGLSKLPKMKDVFRSFTLTHAYTCKYNIGNYNSYSTWVCADGSDRTLGFTRDVTTSLPIPTSAYDITNVTLQENFSPLIGVNMTLKNSLTLKGEYRKQRNLALNVTSVQLTEGHTDEFVIGAGYTIKDLSFGAKNLMGQQKRVTNDLKLSLDLSYKNIKSFMRKVDEGIAQTSNGNKSFTLKFAADYVVSQKINLQLYYDHESVTPLLSTSYPVRRDNIGLNIKIMLTR